MIGRFVLPAIPARSFANAFERLRRALLDWHDRARQRDALLTMDDRILKDLAISRLDAMREARKLDPWRLV